MHACPPSSPPLIYIHTHPPKKEGKQSQLPPKSLVFTCVLLCPKGSTCQPTRGRASSPKTSAMKRWPSVVCWCVCVVVCVCVCVCVCVGGCFNTQRKRNNCGWHLLPLPHVPASQPACRAHSLTHLVNHPDVVRRRLVVHAPPAVPGKKGKQEDEKGPRVGESVTTQPSNQSTPHTPTPPETIDSNHVHRILIE